MKRQHLKICLCYITFLLAVPSVLAAGQFKVIRIHAGDTVTAYGQDIEIIVTLLGIDAPESSMKYGQPAQPYSKQAKEFLSELILNKDVEIKGYGLDPFNRILGVIYVNGVNVNLEMLKAGLAEVYRGRSAGNDIMPYRRAEAQAQAAKRGIWSLGKYYVSPKDWRRKHEQ